jgi:hypothetical protein
LKSPCCDLKTCLVKVRMAGASRIGEATHITMTLNRLYYTEKQISSVCRKFFIICRNTPMCGHRGMLRAKRLIFQ